MYFGKGVGSFHARSKEFVGQRAQKLLAVKVGELVKNLRWALGLVEPLGPDSTQTGCKSFSKFGNFAAL